MNNETPIVVHGGPDADGVPVHDFSTNANACGACPEALRALQAADPRHYPDPAYTALSARLAAWHCVAPERIVLAASASEFIARISIAVALRAGPSARVWLPSHAYGDYARAGRAAGLAVTGDAGAAALLWACEPSSPLGQAEPGLARRVGALRGGQVLVLDEAYAPLRLSGEPSLSGAALDGVWRLITPNKALGLTGVRAAYAIAPLGASDELLARLRLLAPSWPLGAHGVALLHSWASPAIQDWLADSRERLRAWKARQVDALRAEGWRTRHSDANFFVAALAVQARDLTDSDLNRRLVRLRRLGFKLRECTSFGLPGHVRMAVVSPDVQDALLQALRDVEAVA